MRRRFFCIDSHACGNPVRVVAGGGPLLPSVSMAERREIFVRDHDWVRTSLMFEPRGHDIMSGVIIYPSTRDDCDFGALFIEVSGCLPMCGAGTIGLSTVVIEEGLITPREPGKLAIETPAGRVDVVYTLEGEHVSSVSLHNVASYLHSADVEVEVPGVGTLRVDIAYGGNFYAVVEPQENWPGLEGQSATDIVGLSVKLRAALAHVSHPVHPENSRISGVHHVIWCDKPKNATAHGRCAVFYGDKAIDRSPGGTGTSARMAQLYGKGRLPAREFDRYSLRGQSRGEHQGRRLRRHETQHHRLGAGDRPQHYFRRRPGPARPWLSAGVGGRASQRVRLQTHSKTRAEPPFSYPRQTLSERREFSGGMKGKNLRYLDDNKNAPCATTRAGFLLLEHFSLPAFTQVLDTIVTANLLRPRLFTSRTFGLKEGEVVSDLGLVIRPDAKLELPALKDLDLLVICGGYRTELKANEALINLLITASELGLTLAGLWNGAWFLGAAGLLEGYRCAIHPEHRPALAEISKVTHVTSEPFVVDRGRLTASSPSGAFHMALEWIKALHDKALVEGIEDILSFEESRYRRIKPSRHITVSAPLKEVVKLMDANLEEPLEMEQLAVYAGRSRRQIERLFKEQLGTTPQRYYLELRITEARRLLQHTELSQVEVLVACGFVSPSHFSKCYSSYFGYRPSKEKRLVK